MVSCGVSGFDNSDVLAGRPYGGCAILWRSDLMANVTRLTVDSKRLCAVHISTDKWKLLIVNVYMPYENDDESNDEFVQLLSLIENLIYTYPGSHVLVGGDFNVDFNRDWVHTALLDSFCDNIGLSPIIRHLNSNIDYTYNFNMTRFSILDHFLLSGTLFAASVMSASVVHDVDNTSDHDPLVLNLLLDARYIGLSNRVFTPHVSWAKASDYDLNNYKTSLSNRLSAISIPYAALLCRDLRCQNCAHHNAMHQYLDAISEACLTAGEDSLPHTSARCPSSCIPGWSERVEPLRKKIIVLAWSVEGLWEPSHWCGG